jgi:hypothetical protein
VANAKVKIRIQPDGTGELFIRGVSMGHVMSGFRVFSEVGKGTMLQLDVHVDEIDLEGDVNLVLNELRPKPTTPPAHKWYFPKVMGPEICKECRVIRGKEPSAVCPGQPEWFKKQQAANSAPI